MKAYTQIDCTGRAETPSLDPHVFDQAKGPIISCDAKIASNYTDESLTVDFCTGERERVEAR